MTSAPVMKMRRRSKALIAIAVLLGITPLAIMLWLRPKFYNVPTASMEPAIAGGDQVLGIRPFGGFSNLPRGTVVIYEQESPSAPKALWVKRIAAIAGDKIELVGGELQVNGTPLPVRGGLHSRPAGPVPPTFHAFPIQYPYTVPEGCVFVLGDKYDNSLDSRYLGPVRTDAIVRVARTRVFPLSHYGRIE